jgi:hypothetical protein
MAIGPYSWSFVAFAGLSKTASVHIGIQIG